MTNLHSINPPNARFKVMGRTGDPVTLTLRDGQSLSWHHHERTDEGWSAAAYTWSLDGGDLKFEATFDGVDCDGRVTRYTDMVARVEEISLDRWPQWEEESYGQHDLFAEAMNY